MKKLIIDNFAGGGGASTGIESAIGRPIDIAINHDPAAIAMYKANHPGTKVYCENVWEVVPKEATQGQPVALCWFSPDCKHFSKAKGGKPVDKNIRGLAWVAVKWAKEVHPDIIILENVEEFKTWGPLLINGMPDPDKKGETFHLFVRALERQGYKVAYRELIACDYGAPTSRKRFFLIARRDGKPIVWPKPTHGDPEGIEVRYGLLNPWRTAAEIVDWSDLGKSIFGRKNPLKDKTMQRIANGIQKFILDNKKPYIVPENKAAAFLIQYHSETAKSEVRGQSLHEPIMTIDSNPRYGLVSAFITKFYKTGIGQMVDVPLHTVTTSPGHFGIVSAFMIKYYGNSTVCDVRLPIDTLTTKDRFGLVTVEMDGVTYAISDIFLRMLKPRETFNGQGFPEDYIIDRDADGKPYPAKEQTAKCGNAVPPPFAEALVRANLPELCADRDLISQNM